MATEIAGAVMSEQTAGSGAQARPKLYATHRIFTGTSEGRGYIYNRETNKIVWACPHRHPYIRQTYRGGIPTNPRNAGVRAQECAERQLRRLQKHACSAQASLGETK